MPSPYRLPPLARTATDLPAREKPDVHPVSDNPGPHPHRDRWLLSLLNDSYREFQNALNKHKLPESLRKNLKDVRCFHPMVAALNRQDPGLNLLYCDGLREFDALLKKIESGPAPSSYRALTRCMHLVRECGDVHYLAIQIHKSKEGKIYVLGLEALGDQINYENSSFKKLLAEHANVSAVIVPLDVQKDFNNCAIHCLYLLQQLAALGDTNEDGSIGGIPYHEFSQAFAIKEFTFPLSFYGLMESTSALEKLPRHLRDAHLPGIDVSLWHRIVSNRVASPDLKRFCQSANLYRAELLRLTIKWAETTPWWEVRSQLWKSKLHIAMPGTGWMRWIPLTRAKTPTQSDEWHSVDGAVLKQRAQDALHAEPVRQSQDPSAAEAPCPE